MNSTPVYLRCLWWRHTWTFQAAHKPLCRRFHRDVLRIGPLRVCRSCTLLYGSLLMVLASLLVYLDQLAPTTGSTVSGFTLAIIAASAPPSYRHLPRRVRDVLRGSLGAIIGLNMALLVSPAWAWGLGNGLALAGAWTLYQRLRSPMHHHPDLCSGCAESGTPGICSGFQEQSAHLRAYEEAATNWLERNYRPELESPPRPAEPKGTGSS